MSGRRVRMIMAAAAAAALGAGAAAACSGGGGGTGPGPGPTTGAAVAQVSAGGSGVQGATVAISGGGAQSTGSNGQTRFDGLQPGAYTLTLQQLPAGFTMGGETAAKGAAVTAGGTATVSWAVQGGGGGGAQATVQLEGTAFSPATVTIAAGGSVTFEYVSGGPHTVTPENPAGSWSERNMTSTSDNFTVTFATPGTYRYRCVPHSSSFSAGMVGVVVVQ